MYGKYKWGISIAMTGEMHANHEVPPFGTGDARDHWADDSCFCSKFLSLRQSISANPECPCIGIKGDQKGEPLLCFVTASSSCTPVESNFPFDLFLAFVLGRLKTNGNWHRVSKRSREVGYDHANIRVASSWTFVYNRHILKYTWSTISLSHICWGHARSVIENL